MQARSRSSLYSLSDEELMEQFQSGKTEAFELLVYRYKDRLHNFLYRYTRSREDSEDLAQETFLRVHRSKDSYRRIAKFSTWMYTIALNLAKSLYNKKQRFQKISMHEDPEDSESRKMVFENGELPQDEVFDQRESVRYLEKSLKELSPEFRDVIVLRDIQKLSYEEIAEITDTAMGTVKSRINRGRIQLKEILEGYFDNLPQTS